MPVAAHIDPNSRIVTFRCTGNVAINDAKRAFDQMVTDPAVFPDAHTLWDLRGATLAERPRAIPDLLDMLHTRHPDRIAGKRVAILVAEEHGARVSTLVERATSADMPTVRVFLNYARAASWLAGQDM